MILSRYAQSSQYKKLYSRVFYSLPFWISAAIAAVVAVLFAKVFAISEEWALSHASNPLIYLTAPLAITGSFLLGHFFSKEALGSGIPQIIAAVELPDEEHPIFARLLSFRMFLTKILGACICVLGGGSTGREGPTLQISAAIFYQVSRFWPRSLPRPPQNLMILAGGAGGLAAAFNTPLGGVVFAIEELSKSHITKVRTSIFQAVIIAGIISQMLLGNYLYLGHPDFNLGAPWIFLQTLFIATVVGFTGAVFAESLYRVGKWRKQKSFYIQLGMTVVCALAFAATIWLCGPTTLGGGKIFMSEALKNAEAAPNILVPLSRIFGNYFTYTAGVIGGVFAPALASGAAMGQYMTGVFGFGAPRIMMLVGMVAFLTGLTRTPFTSMVLVLEMTNSHEIVLYLMLSSFVASLVSHLVSRKSFYEQAAAEIIGTLPHGPSHAQE
jgi:H+/Cl- antiporter ClcA